LKHQGQRLGGSWGHIIYRDSEPNEEGHVPNAQSGDFVDFVSKFGLTVKAFNVVGTLFSAYGELLPVKMQDSDEVMYIFNCLNIVGALDLANAEVRRTKEPDGLIIEYRKYAFFTEKIGGNQVFQLPGDVTILCTEPFKQKIEKSALTGLDFYLEWSDEPAGIAYLQEQKLQRMGGPSVAVN
jgi:hypothetical protein